jgi:hypothetical protein
MVMVMVRAVGMSCSEHLHNPRPLGGSFEGGREKEEREGGPVVLETASSVLHVPTQPCRSFPCLILLRSQLRDSKCKSAR